MDVTAVTFMRGCEGHNSGLHFLNACSTVNLGWVLANSGLDDTALCRRTPDSKKANPDRNEIGLSASI